MNAAQARKWVVISALTVAGVWGYRRWREGPDALMKFPEFATAWGATYFILSMIAEAAPRFAGSFAVLILVSDILENAKPGDKKKGLLADLAGQQKGKPAAASSATLKTSPRPTTQIPGVNVIPGAAAGASSPTAQIPGVNRVPA